MTAPEDSGMSRPAQPPEGKVGSRICPRCGFATMRDGPQGWECGRIIDCGYREHDMVDRRPAPEGQSPPHEMGYALTCAERERDAAYAAGYAQAIDDAATRCEREMGDCHEMAARGRGIRALKHPPQAMKQAIPSPAAQAPPPEGFNEHDAVNLAQWTAARNRCDELQAMLNKAWADRDALRAERDAHLASCVDVQDLYLKALARAEAAEKERDSWKCGIDVLAAQHEADCKGWVRQIDESKAKLAAAQAELVDANRRAEVRGAGCGCSDADACRFARERDAAQAEVRRMWGALDEITRSSGYACKDIARAALSPGESSGKGEAT